MGKHLTKTLFSHVRTLQDAGNTVEQITAKLGVSAEQQIKCFKIRTEKEWDRLQGVKALQKRSRRTNERLGFKQQIIQKRAAAKQSQLDRIESKLDDMASKLNEQGLMMQRTLEQETITQSGDADYEIALNRLIDQSAADRESEDHTFYGPTDDEDVFDVPETKRRSFWPWRRG